MLSAYGYCHAANELKMVLLEENGEVKQDGQTSIAKFEKNMMGSDWPGSAAVIGFGRALPFSSQVCELAITN